MRFIFDKDVEMLKSVCLCVCVGSIFLSSYLPHVFRHVW